MRKYRLFAPGPTAVAESASLAMAGSIIHHRTRAFEAVLEEVRRGLKWLFQTKNEILILASSGTGAMEGAVTNLFSKGEKVIVVDGGKFGERWWKICKAYGVEPEIIKVPWGEAVSPADVEKLLKKGGYKGVLVQASESSTGVTHPIEKLADLTRGMKDCLLVVDAISALGAMDLPMDRWGIDALIGASQKALALPPGLALIGLSDKAWQAAEKGNLPRFYFDFRKELKGLVTNQTAYTPAIGLIFGLAERLKAMQTEGLQPLFERHQRLSDGMRAGVTALGLALFAKSPVNSLTAVIAPSGIDGQKIYKTLQEKYNLTIAGGQDDFKGKIFRLAHMGHYDDLDVVTVLAALEWTLADLGYRFEMGAGVGAAMKVLHG
ncbi:MAG: alanine--glyoxylate aminotransferase family protein [Deltaproteobacteria bacterium]|nr:alanine--glyoxylate aminotransferase family protein [Deltaproteobacteria bacterium]MBI2501206.1 alanine--glyoxylate aminotransferase family protein [Deltaproteobacteria bacterium]MBI4196530.1 alanine--glyoxylate aminotransferase family protein [Deltaproteobacteria bacterium]